MGVIRRQSLKTSIISFIGVVIGTLSTWQVYPRALEIVGLFRSLFDAAVLIGIVVLLGSSVSAVRFYPRYEDRNTGHGGLLSWLLIVTGTGFGIFLLAYPFVREALAAYVFRGDNSRYGEFIIYLVPLTLFISLMNLLSRYTSNFRRITVPAAFEQLTIKVTLPLIVLMYIGGWITVKGVVVGIVLSFMAATLGMAYYLYHLGEWRLRRPMILRDKKGLREYARFSWYGLLSGIGSQVAFRIDGLMVSGMLSFQANGIYTIAWAMSEIISKPMRALSHISGPLLAYQIEHDQLEEVRKIYRKSSLNMTIAGMGLFLGIWTILPYVFRLMPNTAEIEVGRYAVFFLGLAQVWDMMTGVNNEIIYYSKHYRFALYTTLLLAALNLGTNVIFIPAYGLTGAALATCLSIFLYNAAKLLFIHWKMGLHPFSLRLVPAVGFAVAAWLVATALPETGSALLTMGIKGAAFAALYGLAVWRFAISEDINHWIDGIVGRGRKMLGGRKPDDGA
jgi:O-antigen/teichoic acid export membrane protein